MQPTYVIGSAGRNTSGRARRPVELGERLARLTALKDRYEPANVFRLNANIPPSASV